MLIHVKQKSRQLTKEEQHILQDIKLSAIRKILKFPLSTYKIILYGKRGEFPITYAVEKRQLMY